MPTGMPMTPSTRCSPRAGPAAERSARCSSGAGPAAQRSTRCGPSATGPRPIDRGLQRLAVAAARVGRAADDVDVAADAGLQRLLAQDRLGAGVDRLGAGVVAAELEGLDAGQLAAR